jgi:hypothetical protein
VSNAWQKQTQMKKQLFALVLSVFVTINCYSQIIFENGYFIDEDNQKIECLIKNLDWKDNPTAFEYKLSPDAEVKKADIQRVNEFGIHGSSKYIRATVKIDRSGDDLKYLNYERNPVFQEEQLFLKVLIEGGASLFLYEDEGLIRFFYKVDDPEISQLVYKKYLPAKNSPASSTSFATNDTYKQQLFLDLKSQNISRDKVERIAYKKSDLTRLFIQYNESNNHGYLSFETKQKRDKFNLTIRPGLTFRNLSTQLSVADYGTMDFGTNPGMRFGVETEYIFPFNKNKWTLVIEPTFQFFKTEKEVEANVVGGVSQGKVDYKALELPVGIRYYFFLKKSKLFINTSFVCHFAFNSTIEFTRSNGYSLNSLNINEGINVAIGAGYKINRYSFEMRYLTPSNLLSDYLYWNSDYKGFSIIVGYSIL